MWIIVFTPSFFCLYTESKSIVSFFVKKEANTQGFQTLQAQFLYQKHAMSIPYVGLVLDPFLDGIQG